MCNTLSVYCEDGDTAEKFKTMGAFSCNDGIFLSQYLKRPVEIYIPSVVSDSNDKESYVITFRTEIYDLDLSATTKNGEKFIRQEFESDGKKIEPIRMLYAKEHFTALVKDVN